MDIKPFTKKEKIIVFFACALGWAHDAKTKSLLKYQTASNNISTTNTLCHYYHIFPVTIE